MRVWISLHMKNVYFSIYYSKNYYNSYFLVFLSLTVVNIKPLLTLLTSHSFLFILLFNSATDTANKYMYLKIATKPKTFSVLRL